VYQLNLLSNFHDYTIFALYLLTFLLGVWVALRLNTPLYYPLVKWWEYDFRFTQVWKVEIKKREDVSEQPISYSGRITDMRRGDLCLVLFEDISLGEILHIHQKTAVSFPFGWPEAKIFSKRYNNVGRGISYGVKLIAKNRKERKQIRQAQKAWNISMRMKKKYKFSFQHPL
jgi:hypothetical protein